MPRIEITHETTWSAEYTVYPGDGIHVVLTGVAVDGESLRWWGMPDVIENQLIDAARAVEAERMREAAGAEVDAKILERKEGERC